MAKKILLVGCGQLGSRHLQAVASLKGVTEVHVVDPSPEAIELGKSRLSQVADLNKNIKFSWFEDLDKSSQAGDLCLIATQAKVRPLVLKRVARELNYKRFFIEKIVSQSLEEYQDLVSFSEVENLKVWVNCKVRTYDIHRYIKSRLNPAEPIVFSRIGGNHGLANSGIHTADLFVFYDGASKISNSGCRIEQLQSSKRGGEIYDLSGDILGYSDKASSLIISFSAAHLGPDVITISSPTGRFIIDHSQKAAWESCADSNWTWRNIPIDQEWQVSQMSKKFASDILLKGSCDLPTIQDCYPAHEFILTALLPYFNKLLKAESKVCPVT